MENLIVAIVAVVIGIIFEAISGKGKNKESAAEADKPKPRPSFMPKIEIIREPRPRRHHVEPVAEPIPEEGVRVTPQKAEPEKPLETPVAQTSIDSDRDRRLRAHYARWRQAIIDAQMLQTKF